MKNNSFVLRARNLVVFACLAIFLAAAESALPASASDTLEKGIFTEETKGEPLLTEVGRQSPDEMQRALTDLSNRGMKALVLYLRSNPGGPSCPFLRC
jgi:hypothetical protein